MLGQSSGITVHTLVGRMPCWCMLSQHTQACTLESLNQLQVLTAA